MLTDEKIKELDEAEKRATPGPWAFVDGRQNGPSDEVIWISAAPNDSYGYACNYHQNAKFIVLARNHLRELLDEVKEYRRVAYLMSDDESAYFEKVEENEKLKARNVFLEDTFQNQAAKIPN